jgi:hypothetical protein
MKLKRVGGQQLASSVYLCASHYYRYAFSKYFFKVRIRLNMDAWAVTPASYMPVSDAASNKLFSVKCKVAPFAFICRFLIHFATLWAFPKPAAVIHDCERG